MPGIWPLTRPTEWYSITVGNYDSPKKGKLPIFR
jgi:hypothetical protein